MMIVLFISGAVTAQGNKQLGSTKSFLAFHAGPSFPVGDFSKTSLDNPQAGFAKTGYNLNLTYGYQISREIGLAASVFYNNNKLDNGAIVGEIGGVSLDHWQWYGITAGPMFTQKVGDNVDLGVRIMGGVANANSPKVVEEGNGSAVLVKEDWSASGVFQTGLDLRFGLSRNVFIITNVEYLYMKPKFDLVFPDGSPTERSEQKMSVLNLTAGIGIRF